jgi:hypothetical protein
MVRVMAAMGSGKGQAWPPMDHFEKLLKETCPNHAYPIKHKLRHCGMMMNFMALAPSPEAWKSMRSPDEGGATPFPGEDVVMKIDDRHTSPRVSHVPDSGPRTLAHSG